MDLILVDTSVWVNFFKGIPTDASLYLKLRHSSTLIATCPTIIQEILQRVVSDKDEKKVSSYFNNVTQLIEEPYQIAVQAAELYRFLRKQGVTIRKPNDCLIAMYAIKNNIPILHDDKDFDFIAAHTALKIVK
jgi:predicted nucleic acid-binding protein